MWALCAHELGITGRRATPCSSSSAKASWYVRQIASRCAVIASASSSCAQRKAALTSLGAYELPMSTHEYLSTCPRKNRRRFVPLSRRISARSASAASLMSRAPPSPQCTFFVSWKLRAARLPKLPSGRSSIGREDPLGGVLDKRRRGLFREFEKLAHLRSRLPHSALRGLRVSSE